MALHLGKIIESFLHGAAAAFPKIPFPLPSSWVFEISGRIYMNEFPETMGIDHGRSKRRARGSGRSR